MVGMRRLGRPVAFALALWGLPLLLIGIQPGVVISVAALVASGVGNALLDVAGFTLMQRIADDRVLGRVFGVFYVGVLATTGIGSILAPALVDLIGVRGSLAIGGVLLPGVALAIYPRLRRMDKYATVPDPPLSVLAGVPLFEPLPPTSLEKLARAALPETVSAGTIVVAQGDRGDMFYVVLRGSFEVSADGEFVRTIGPGDFFGEIALLRESPRTATVSATTEATVLAISRMDFLSAVLGNPDSARTVDEIVSSRVGFAPV